MTAAAPAALDPGRLRSTPGRVTRSRGTPLTRPKPTVRENPSLRAAVWPPPASTDPASARHSAPKMRPGQGELGTRRIRDLRASEHAERSTRRSTSAGEVRTEQSHAQTWERASPCKHPRLTRRSTQDPLGGRRRSERAVRIADPTKNRIYQPARSREPNLAAGGRRVSWRGNPRSGMEWAGLHAFGSRAHFFPSPTRHSFAGIGENEIVEANLAGNFASS
jgi:hypothetical protein